MQSEFQNNPFEAIKNELKKDDPPLPPLDVAKEEIIEHFRHCYSDKEKDNVYLHPEFLPTSDGSIMSEVEFPSLTAFVCIMEKKKNKCAPGPNWP